MNDASGLAPRWFTPIEGKPMPEQLLKGKSGRIIVTADSPAWYDYLIMKRPVINQFKKGTLRFCGINPVKVTFIGSIKNSELQYRKKWLNKITQLGEQLN